VRANREGYSRIQIRARRLINVEDIDMSVNLFGTRWNTPIVLSPVSGQKAFHPEGEVAVARAARTKGHLMMLSTVATSSIEDAIAARSGPVWQPALSHKRLGSWPSDTSKRAETAGAPAIVLTVDLQEGSTAKLYSVLSVSIKESVPLAIKAPTRATLGEGPEEAREASPNTQPGSRCSRASICPRSLLRSPRISVGIS